MTPIGGLGAVARAKPPTAAPAPQPAPQGAPTPAPQGGASGATHVGPAFAQAGGLDAPNLQVMQALKARQTKACGPEEVAPGVWVRIDCHLYTAPGSATIHNGTRKLKLINTHKTIRTQSLFLANGSKRVQAGLTSLGGRLGGGGAPPVQGGAPPVQGGGGPPVQGGGGAPKGDDVETLADTSDHRQGNGQGPIKYQEYVGSCTAFALSAVMDNLVRRAGKQDVTSPAHLWSRYGYPNMQQAVDNNIRKTVVNQDVWPYSGREACKLSRYPNDDCAESYSVTSGSWANDSAIQAKIRGNETSGTHKIVSVEKLTTSPVNIDEILQTLASGVDLWVAFKIDGRKWSSRSVPSNGVIPDWDNWTGGHAVALAGYRTTPQGRQYLIHNSWGQSWADRGYGWVSEKMVKEMMYYAYRLKLDANDKPVELTDDDCGPDELIDGGTNQCAPICPDESRPTNGKC
jgi:hypothetical protein